MDYNAFFNVIARRRGPSTLHDNNNLDGGFVLMATGLPNPDMFPVISAEFTLRDGTTTKIDESAMKRCLQYGHSAGHPRLKEFVRNLICTLHNPPLMDKDPDHPAALVTICTSGCQDAIYKIFECTIDEGDTVLTEDPVYPRVLLTLPPLGTKIQGLKTDQNGIIPEHLTEILSNWRISDNNEPSTDSQGGKLKALYMIPSGGNPKGMKYTDERKREIYSLAQKYNFLIIEDQAYSFLEQQPYSKSFLSMDVDGRVLRLDSFSKTIGPGFRIGAITGPRTILKKIISVSMISSRGGSLLSQTILLTLLEKWGIEGYLQHCENVAKFYDVKRKQCMELADKHLAGLVEYEKPSSGMFLWLKCKTVQDTTDLCLNRLKEQKVLMVPGVSFKGDKNEDCQFIRVAFTIADLEQIEKGFRILAEELRKMSPHLGNVGIIESQD